MNGENQGTAPNGGGQWQYKPEAPQSPAPAPAVQPPTADGFAVPEESDITWTASEFIEHEKGAGWVTLLMLATIAIAALIYFVTRDVLSTGLVVVIAIICGIAAMRKPRVLNYMINEHGLAVGQKFYPYSEFKSFAVMDEGAFSSIMLIPLKRFMVPLSIYYDPQDEERIVSTIGSYLPMEDRKHDMFDQLTRRLRF